MKNYIVPKDILLDLLKSRDKLQCLEADGVDNWSWYMEGAHQFLKEGAEIYGVILDEDCCCNGEDFWFEDLAELELQDFQEV